MSTPDSTNFTTFDIWLDAFVAGMSTPASRAASNSETAGLRDAARQFHGLARNAEQSAAEHLPAAPYPANWKDFMSTTTSAHQLSAAAGDLAHASVLGPRPRSYRGSHWHVALNVALAAAVILALSVGIWRATDGFNSSGNGGNDHQAAFAPDTTVWTPEAADATPDPASERSLLPTADECTVEPLSVDEVLWYIKDPLAANRSRTMESPATPEAESAATPPLKDEMPVDPLIASPPAIFEPGPASPEQLVAIAEVQRMWMACVLADSPFQRWALQSPEQVAWEARALFPTFASEDEVQQILEAVEAGGEMWPSDDFWNQPNASWVNVTGMYNVYIVNPETATSWTDNGRTFLVSYISYPVEDSPAGAAGEANESVWLETPGPGTETPDDPSQGLNICSSFEFTWFEGRSQLLVSALPRCG